MMYGFAIFIRLRSMNTSNWVKCLYWTHFGHGHGHAFDMTGHVSYYFFLFLGHGKDMAETHVGHDITLLGHGYALFRTLFSSIFFINYTYWPLFIFALYMTMINN